MDLEEANRFFDNYRNHVKDKSKISIGYDNAYKMVEAYEVLEKSIKTLTVNLNESMMSHGETIELNCGLSLVISTLTEENRIQKNCLERIYKVDLPLIDKLCDMQKVHRYTLMRADLEAITGLEEN